MEFLRTLFRHNFATLLTMFLLGVVPLLGSSSVLLLLYRHQHLLEHLTALQTLAYFVAMGLAMAFALANSTLLVIITGYYLGWGGLPGLVAAYVLAAAVGYELALRLDHGKLRALLGHFPKAGALLAELQTQSWPLIVLTRLSPVLPFALMTFVLAMVGVPRRRFLAASLLGMLPRSLFFFWLGTEAQDVLALLRDPGQGTGTFWALLLASLFGLFYVFNRALQRALRGAATAEASKIQP